ncbi:hypothetical protein GCS60_000575 [Vibrio metschnikovii]|nr:hypothetical protein [Vibrio metschnikovii]
MKTISKERYLEVLLNHLNYLNNKEEVHPEDLEALVEAYEDAKRQNFEEVEVIQNGEAFSFKPIFLEE